MKVGKVTGNALKRSVLKQVVPTEYGKEIISGAALGADCAFLACPQDAKAAACVQEAAVATKADMELLVGRCANSIAAGGAKPVAALLGLILPESVEEPELKDLTRTAREACEAYGMQIVGGHTTVSRAVSCPFAALTVWGRLTLDQETSRRQRKAAHGQDIVISKWIGLEGTALLAKSYKERLEQRYPAYLVEEAAGFDRYMSVLKEAEIAAQAGACAMHDASEGGILAALWELAESAGTGLTIDLKKLPIRQETVEVCECLGANPYELRSGGCLIMTAEDGEALKEALWEAQIPAVVVGKLTQGKERLILNEEEVRYMDRPQVDEIYRFLDC